ncbi:hypothetical protein [Natronorubrum sulfidifaciens]|uniref:Uncharacterized protein n=1 Tax=Natronorubrum sulfidifaciens JCM 14089 TaxID=1230460 RepID=L9W4A9_9EURY|nr:hypothetical protein [Natronorubrum sulfidifaciens]ELY44314.1 hypothetical protein C495_10444 [Natronorubrum sulfidifaciens JCM 14089]
MHLENSVTAVGFWLGTLLPVAYFPVFLSGIDSTGSLSVFLALLALHVTALVIGHDYPGSRSQ